MTISSIEDLQHDAPFDLLVIGGGINGVAIARDAALRGMSVILVEKDDLASGTTSWSTRLIHGGLRYLEHREFGLVRESLRERERLLRNAPHLVAPLPLLIPVYDHARRGRHMIRAGMMLYDLLSIDKSLPRHRFLSRSETLVQSTYLASKGLSGAFEYFDAQCVFPERLVVEQMLDASACGAIAVTHSRVAAIACLPDGRFDVSIVEQRSGDRRTLHATAVVNAAGPWVDAVLQTVACPAANGQRIGGTKGVHCFLPARPRLAAVYAEARADNRPFFVLPWNGLTMIGTTDTRYQEDLDNVPITPDDLAYLLDEANRLLPGAAFEPSDIAFAYAGIRPLPTIERGAEAGITRRHFVESHAPDAPGLFTVIGGKLTTHRSLAEHAVDVVIGYLGRHAPCMTGDRPLPGAGAPQGVEAVTDIHVRERLIEVYGARASGVAALGQRQPPLMRRLDPAYPAIGAEIVFAFQSEGAHTLADAILRRMVAAYRADLGMAMATAAADVARARLGWNDARAAMELEDYRAAIQRFRVP
jgi:glycerol-3-phosphate dehydrogenase